MTSPSPAQPVALTIAGSDSGGGAGAQADLKTFAALGVYGTSALTALTAQNPDGVTAIQPVRPDVVAAQIRAVRDYFTVGAAKTGMLHSSAIVAAVADALAEGAGRPPLVVDPVLAATRGARLLDESAIDTLCRRLFPLAALVTPNLAEAALLAEMEVRRREHLEPAARRLYDRYGVPMLVKGGHLEGDGRATDCLFDGRSVEFFTGRVVEGVNTHGTGCTLSAAVAVFLLRGQPLAGAVGAAKHYLQGALAAAVRVGKARAINHGYAPVPCVPD
jgi:hydroxymethylpyrimidine/phosphomethylpyrimidine kinase